jgi:hypothetical protein
LTRKPEFCNQPSPDSKTHLYGIPTSFLQRRQNVCTLLHRGNRVERNAGKANNLFERVVERHDVHRNLALGCQSPPPVNGLTSSKTFSSSFGLILIFLSSGESKVHPAILCSPSCSTRAELVSTDISRCQILGLTGCASDPG